MLRLELLTQPFRQGGGNLSLLILRWLLTFAFGLDGRPNSRPPDFARSRHIVAVVAPLAVFCLSAPVVGGDEQGRFVGLVRGSLQVPPTIPESRRPRAELR